MPRYVILEHDLPTLHYDFMLEADGVLKTWRISQLFIHGEQIAQQLSDHRLAYLEYEGPLTGNRGAVKRVEQGTYELIQHDESTWCIRLLGSRLREVKLTQKQGERWTLQ